MALKVTLFGHHFVSLPYIYLFIGSEAYHIEAFNFHYLFEIMLPIIPDQ